MPDLNQLEKIEALLRKAEATPYPEEAKAFTEKAEALMVKWSIDAAMLRAEETTTDPKSHVQSATVIIWKGPTLAPLALLLNRIVDAHDGQCVYWETSMTNETKGKWQQCRKYVIYAMPEDLQAIQMLYASLQIQAATEYQSDQVQAMRPAKRGPGFKNSFMTGYAVTIGDRLQEARKAQIQHEGSMALVLMDQAVVVKERFEDEHPNLKSAPRSQRKTDSAGYMAGQMAAERANIGSKEIG